MAKNAPEKDFIGIEVHPPGVAKLMMLAKEEGITNLRVYCDDAIESHGKLFTSEHRECFPIIFP